MYIQNTNLVYHGLRCYNMWITASSLGIWGSYIWRHPLVYWQELQIDPATAINLPQQTNIAM